MPRDLLQLYPLDGKLLTLRTTDDDSPTRVLLQLRDGRFTAFPVRVTTEMGATDVRLLARELLQWLVDNGHAVPELDWPDGWDEDEDDQPATVVVPEHTR